MFNSRKRKVIFVPLRKHDREVIRQKTEALAKKLNEKSTTKQK